MGLLFFAVVVVCAATAPPRIGVLETEVEQDVDTLVQLLSSPAAEMERKNEMEVVYKELDQDYDETIKLAPREGVWDHPVTFHTYWHGPLKATVMASLQSCYLTNIKGRGDKRELVLWVPSIEKITIDPNFKQARKYATIKEFQPTEELKGTHFESFERKPNLNALVDVERLILLDKHGGLWFDGDTLFLRSFDPLFKAYHNKMFQYAWEHQNYANNAIMWSPQPKDHALERLIDYHMNKQGGHFHAQANAATYNQKIPVVVLPCSWFDSAWVKNPLFDEQNFFTFFQESDKKYTLDNFFNGAFSYHWHNQWDSAIVPTSPFRQVLDDIVAKYDK